MMAEMTEERGREIRGMVAEARAARSAGEWIDVTAYRCIEELVDALETAQTELRLARELMRRAIRHWDTYEEAAARVFVGQRDMLSAVQELGRSALAAIRREAEEGRQ